MQADMTGLGRTGSNMVTATAVDDVLAQLLPLLEAGDVLIDGGNAYCRDDVRRAAELQIHAICHVDMVISAALFGRFASRGDDDYANQLLSAMRKQFGGHDEKKDEH